MEKRIRIEEEYLYLPICAGKPEKLLEIFTEEGKKVFEFKIPVDASIKQDYPFNYFARFSVKKFTGKTLILEGNAPEGFWKEVVNAPFQEEKVSGGPSTHFVAEHGWINDPNGLVYADGIYHLYFQYNPFNTSWENMCWGHAESRDLLHWKQGDTVLFPDENGYMFSGSGLKNEKGLLGLPKEALIFFYTAAAGDTVWSTGKEFTQRIAYSLDGGRTLEKLEGVFLDTVCHENRDPKVFWHEESDAYIMVLWLEKNDFGIFRSKDLVHWEMSDRLMLSGAWECPDLFQVADEQGEKHWLFWSADGFYFWGEFDGYCFLTDGVRHKAWINRVPYAAQSYSGIRDRVVLVPWLRIPNDGRYFTGAMGMPRELSCRRERGELLIEQRPVHEFFEAARPVLEEEYIKGEEVFYCQKEKGSLYIKVIIDSAQETFFCQLNGIEIVYEPGTGKLMVGEEEYYIGENQEEFAFLMDDKILEVDVNCGIIIGAFVLKEKQNSITLRREMVREICLYEV